MCTRSASPASAFDAAAGTFDRHRALPEHVPDAIRATILAAIGPLPRPRLMDLGAGTGRIGWPFLANGDDYVGVDLSLGMLGEFRRRAAAAGLRALLVRADGDRLPFADRSFDAVMLIQVFGGMRRWRSVLAHARRVLCSPGTLVTGRMVAPREGIDARMRQHLALLLGEMGVRTDANPREDARHWLERSAPGGTQVVAASWDAERTARGFLERHRTGAQFAALPEEVKEETLRRLGGWAEATFGSLDAPHTERHAFELMIFRFTGDQG